MKRKWERPQLQIVGRSKSEEAVLVACKAASSTNQPAYALGCDWGHEYACKTQSDS